jgi:hypothetical protein
MCERHNAPYVIVDSIGIGQGVYDTLAQFRSLSVIKFDSRESASQPHRFINKRAEAWWYVMQLMMDKEVDYPEDLLLRQDLSSVRAKPTGGKIQLENKVTGTKARLGRSPDRGDAFIMGIYGLQQVPDVDTPQDYAQATDIADSYSIKSVL